MKIGPFEITIRRVPPVQTMQETVQTNLSLLRLRRRSLVQAASDFYAAASGWPAGPHDQSLQELAVPYGTLLTELSEFASELEGGGPFGGLLESEVLGTMEGQDDCGGDLLAVRLACAKRLALGMLSGTPPSPASLSARKISFSSFFQSLVSIAMDLADDPQPAGRDLPDLTRLLRELCGEAGD
jgi:hypothetical protein